ncbi:MAG: TlpA family protein disulfide reductase [Acidobacteria bacterium]|nr:TlpA family protein disulfide reductase [Acidobacteriota bacterium]MCB9377307.1 TlpA family protein disulfide reductase [Holophagales bacterium]
MKRHPKNSASQRGSALWALLVLLLVAGVVAWALVAFRAPEGGALGAAGGGEPFPDFSLASIDGRGVTRADLGQRVVLYDFWATWCGPCHLQADILARLYPEARAKGIEFVALATGEPADIVRDFVASRPFQYPVLTDPEEELATRLRIMGLPTLFVVDASGRIVYRNTGLVDANTLRRVLAQAAG